MFFFATGAFIMLAGIAAYSHIYNENAPNSSEETDDLNKKSVDDDNVFAAGVPNFWEKLNLIKVEGSRPKMDISYYMVYDSYTRKCWSIDDLGKSFSYFYKFYNDDFGLPDDHC